jgi:hypothetical protein
MPGNPAPERGPRASGIAGKALRGCATCSRSLYPLVIVSARLIPGPATFSPSHEKLASKATLLPAIDHQ